MVFGMVNDFATLLRHATSEEVGSLEACGDYLWCLCFEPSTLPAHPYNGVLFLLHC